MNFRTALAFFRMVTASLLLPCFRSSGGTLIPQAKLKCLFFSSGFLATILVPIAQAGPVFERLSGPSQLADRCFVRYYDAAHLERHPRQRVNRFHLRRDRSGPDDVNNSLRFTVAIEFRIKERRQRFESRGICVTRGSIAECGGEGDTGSFHIALVGKNLRVELKRLELEGSGADLAESDDRVFLLLATRPQECQG